MKNDYHTTHGISVKDFDDEFDCSSYISVPICQWLTGTPWNDEALAYVWAFNPTGIRVTTGGMKLDAWQGRITVFVDDVDIIQSIEKEVNIPLPGGFNYGADFTKHYELH